MRRDPRRECETFGGFGGFGRFLGSAFRLGACDVRIPLRDLLRRQRSDGLHAGFTVEFDGDGQDVQRYDVTLLASTGGSPWDVSQDLVDTYLSRTGSTSIKAAIESDGTLGGAAYATRVLSWRDYGTLSFGTVDYFGVRFTVEVWPT